MTEKLIVLVDLGLEGSQNERWFFFKTCPLLKGTTVLWQLLLQFLFLILFWGDFKFRDGELGHTKRFAEAILMDVG